MKRPDCKTAKTLFPQRKRRGGNFKGQDEENSSVYRRIKKRAYGTWADGYCPMKPVRGRRGRSKNKNQGASFNQRGEFNVSYGQPYKMWQQKVQMVREFSEAMQNASYFSLDFRNLDLQSLGENDFVYCDPPYLLGDATYNESNGFGGGWDENDERDLLDLLENSTRIR